MKRIILSLVAAFTLFAQNISAAQNVDGDTKHFGVRMQFDMSTDTKYSYMVHWGPGVSVGGTYYAPFGRYTYFNCGLLFGYDTFDYDGDTQNKYNSAHFDGHLSMIGLKLPLEIGFKFFQTDKIRLSVYTGPQIYINFKLKADYTSTHKTYSEKISKDYETSGMDLGWGLGFAADFKRHWHAHVQGTLGLTNMGMTTDFLLGPDEAHFKRAEISIGLGYNF